MELRNYLRIVIQRIWIILPIFVLAMIAAVIYTNREKPTYSAQSTFVARESQDFLDNKNNASALDILSRRTEIATTFSEVAKSRRILFYAAQRLGISQDTRKSLSVDSRLIAGTNIIEISTQGTDPQLVSDFTNAVGVVTTDYVNNLYDAYELIPLDEALPPTAPASPKKTFNYLLGGIIGLALGIGLAFLSESLSIKEKPEEVPSVVNERDSVGRAENATYLQQELNEMKSLFDLTRQQIEQTQLMLRSTKQVAETANTTVKSFTSWLDKFLAEDLPEVKISNNGNGE